MRDSWIQFQYLKHLIAEIRIHADESKIRWRKCWEPPQMELEYRAFSAFATIIVELLQTLPQMQQL